MILVFLYLSIGLFLTWFIQSQKIFEYLTPLPILRELRKCNICMGFWVYLVLYFVFYMGVLDILPQNLFIIILNPIITSAILSFIAHLIRTGYTTIYRITVIT